MSDQTRVSKGVPTGGQFAPSMKTESTTVLAPGGATVTGDPLAGETEVRSFCCEVHDAPGACTTECVDLVVGMSGDGGRIDWYDPTGTSYGAPRPYDTYEYDEENRASIQVTHVPEGEAIARGLTKGQWIVVDGEPREVESVTRPQRGKVWIDFESYDREPDGSPSGYLSREFRADEVFDVAEPDR